MQIHTRECLAFYSGMFFVCHFKSFVLDMCASAMPAVPREVATAMRAATAPVLINAPLSSNHDPLELRHHYPH